MLISKWSSLVLDVDFMTLTSLQLEVSLHIYWIHYLSECIITKNCEKKSVYVLYGTLNKLWTITCSISPACTPLAMSSKIRTLIWDFFFSIFNHHNLLGFLDQFVFEMSMIFFHKIRSQRIVLNRFHSHQAVIMSFPLQSACNQFHQQSYRSCIKHHMPLNTMFSAVTNPFGPSSTMAPYGVLVSWL